MMSSTKVGILFYIFYMDLMYTLKLMLKRVSRSIASKYVRFVFADFMNFLWNFNKEVRQLIKIDEMSAVNFSSRVYHVVFY